jgi:EAL domain-containing protein (putative c-di-GMP-specific phosphodiesterase class I)
MSINVSGKQIDKIDLPAILKDIVINHEIPFSAVRMELTESILINRSNHAKWILEEIKKLGISLAIDDFGVGYSSLGTLKDYPFDTLKIDRSFITNLQDPKAKQTVEAITVLGNTLKMATIVEGIETVEQLKYLQGLNIDYAQGFLLGRPMEASQVEDFLIHHRMRYKK